MLTDDQRRAAEAVFRAHGYDEPLRVAPVTSEDERIFLMPADALAALPERTLTIELQQAIGRKVWLTEETPRWGDPEPLH